VLVQMIRHAKTLENEAMLYQGSSDPHISKAGRQQLIDNKNKELYISTDRYYTSDRARAIQTMQELFSNENYCIVPLLTEYNFGDFEMKTNEELMANNEYILWLQDKTGDVKCPNGESNNMFLSRILKGLDYAINDASEHSAESITIISHGGTIAFLYMSLMDEWDADFYSIMPKHSEGYLFDLIQIDSEIIVNKSQRIC